MESCVTYTAKVCSRLLLVSRIVWHCFLETEHIQVKPPRLEAQTCSAHSKRTTKHLGHYQVEEVAARKYDDAAREAGHDETQLNFPEMGTTRSQQYATKGQTYPLLSILPKEADRRQGREMLEAVQLLDQENDILRALRQAGVPEDKLKVPSCLCIVLCSVICAIPLSPYL